MRLVGYLSLSFLLNRLQEMNDNLIVYLLTMDSCANPKENGFP